MSVEGESFGESKGFGTVVSNPADAADPEDAFARIAFSLIARGVFSATTLGNSSATRSIASSSASIASTESSMRVICLEPMVLSTDELSSLAAGCVGARAWESLLVLIDSTNESSVLCSSL